MLITFTLTGKEMFEKLISNNFEELEKPYEVVRLICLVTHSFSGRWIYIKKNIPGSFQHLSSIESKKNNHDKLCLRLIH